MEYFHWKELTIDDFSSSNITRLYNEGFVFTRIDKGVMHQTRSARVDLSRFELSSENRRILKKVSELHMEEVSLPYVAYTWELGKLVKDFYDTKFGPGIFSAHKAKEVLTSHKSNFNVLLNFSDTGYAMCYKNTDILHYSYPFYDIEKSPKDMGLGMMTRALEYAHGSKLKYVYLGSLQRPTDTYKLQFSGLEWFDGEEWRTDTAVVKEMLKKYE